MANAAGDYLTVYPNGSPQPGTANLNPVPGSVVSNAVIVPAGYGGQVVIYNYTGNVNVLVDVSGYYTSGVTSQEVFHPLAEPVRIYDGGQLGAGAVARVGVEGTAGIPPSGVSAVAVALGAGAPTAASYLTAYADGAARPAVTSSSVTAGVAVTTLAQPQVGGDGAIDVYNYTGSLSLYVDVEGYYTNDLGNGGATCRPAAPAVIYDTRAGRNPLGPGETRPVKVADPPLTPPNTSAVALDVTAVDSTAPSLAFGGPIGEYALFAAQRLGDPPPPPGARGMFYENASSVQGDYGTATSPPTQNTDTLVPTFNPSP